MNQTGVCRVLDVLHSCGISKDSVSVDQRGFSFSVGGLLVLFNAHIEDDGYGLFTGEIYRGSLSSREVDEMHAELERLRDSITGDIRNKDLWLRFVRRYDYRHVFEFGEPSRIVPMIVAVAGMTIDDYILDLENGGCSYSDSRKSMIRGGSCGLSLGIFN